MKKSILFLTLVLLFFGCKESKENTKEDKAKILNSAEGAVSRTIELDSLININPNNPDLYYQRSKVFFDLKNHPKALIDILTAIDLNNKNVVYYLLGGDIYLAMSQGDDAIKLMSEAISNNPNNEALYTRSIEYNFYMKNNEAALNFTNDLLRINKNNADAYFFKGLIFKSSDKNKAISSFQTCVEQDPTYYNAYMQLATLFAEKNDDLALKYYDNALKLQPDSREAVYGKGYFYQQRKQYELAREEYKIMIIEDRRDFQALFNTAHCFLAQDSIVKAEKHFEMALNVKPDYVDAIYMLGQIAERKGDIVNAKIHYQNALKLLPNNETILESLKKLK